MEKLNLSFSWLNNLLPDGYPYPSTTVISGPGGSGKPLIGLAIVHDWLKSGGSVVAIPLQYPDMEFVGQAFEKLYGLRVKDYEKEIAYVKFNPEIEEIKKNGKRHLEANLLKPEVWEKVLGQAEETISSGKQETLFFGSALNLLLFSPTYGDKALNKLIDIIKNYQDNSFLLAVSTSAYREKIKSLEEAAENLMFTKMKDQMKLEIEIARIEEVESSKEPIEAPIPKEILEEIKEIAERTRKRAIPKIKGI